MDIPITHKKCATCRYWSGAREIIFVGTEPKFVRVAGVIDSAPCSAWQGRKYAAAGTCGIRWCKWERL